MRIHAISDIHVDFAANARWVSDLSLHDYRDDVLILAGDIADELGLLTRCFRELARRFRAVLYVPGNHDLWVSRGAAADSFEKLRQVRERAIDSDVQLGPYSVGSVSIVPLMGWYDYSFGAPSAELLDLWMDQWACRWPEGFDAPALARLFADSNGELLAARNDDVISFSHFVPRIDLMPSYIPARHRLVYPVLGSSLIEEQIRVLRSGLHVYGHSHVNRDMGLDGVRYVNNALGYPSETRISGRRLACIYES